MAQVSTNIQTVNGRRQPVAGTAAAPAPMRLLAANAIQDTFTRTAPTAGAAAPALPTAAEPTAIPAAPAVPAVPAAPATSAVPAGLRLLGYKPTATAVVPPAAPTVPVAPPVAAPVAPVAPTILNAASTDEAYRAAIQILSDNTAKRHELPAQDPVFNDFSPIPMPWEQKTTPSAPVQTNIPMPWDPKPAPPAEKPEPADKPEAPSRPDPKPSDSAGMDRLKNMSAEELARLGRENKKEFFAVLRPAAEEAERKYGVPAAITLAQAALETGWGQHIIPGFNIFGIKGTGPAGTVKKGTWEVYDGKTVTITANFAKYHDFYEAVFAHGKLFHNGYYDKAMAQYKRDKDPHAFGRNITGTYATDPAYGSKLSSIMRQYDLV